MDIEQDNPQDENPFGVPEMSAGLNRGELDLRGGEGFWEEVERFSQLSSLGGHLDEAIAGRAAPRVWVILGNEAAASGLIVSRLLADRGQSVVLLDADEAHAPLTHWLGRHEQEGWIDMIRYGASRTTASDTLPSSGRRGAVIGVGSFTPTGATGEEIGDLVARLRRQADDLVVVAPAVPGAAPWCRTADLRLLAWDRLDRSEEEILALTEMLREHGIVLDGMITFGAEEYAALQRLTPVPEPALAPIAATAPVEPGGPEFPDPDLVTVAAELPPAAAPRRGSSGGLRFVAVLGGLAVLAVGYLVINANRTAPPSPHRPAVTQPARDPATADLANRVPDATMPSPESVSPVTPDTAAARAETSPPPVAPAAAATVAAPVPVVPTPAAGAFDLAPYRAPVGEAGWALWLYSQHSQAAADADVVTLNHQGFQATTRAVDLPEKGHWYRIYVGSFPSKEAAQQAAPALLAHLHHDWAQAARF